MTTALDIIKRSMRQLGVYAIGEAPTSDEADTGLTALNAMLGTLSTSPMVYAKSLDTITLAANVASITVGPSGGTVTPRPIEVLNDSYILIGTQTYSLDILTLQQYSDIGVKSIASIPRTIWPSMDMPNVTLTFWPVPAYAMTLNLWSQKLLPTFATLATVASLPPGYEDALSWLLAEALAPEYGMEPPPSVVKNANRTRRALESTNFEPPMLELPAELQRLRFNILTNTAG